MVLVACLLAGVVSYGMFIKREQGFSDFSNMAAEITPEQKEVEVVSYVALPGESVLGQLQREATVETKASPYGTLVESINGVVNGADGKYWLFYVDGQMAEKGADAYITDGGEKIEWKFSK